MCAPSYAAHMRCTSCRWSMQPRCRLIGLTLRATVTGERTTFEGLAERNHDIAGSLAATWAPHCTRDGVRSCQELECLSSPH